MLNRKKVVLVENEPYFKNRVKLNSCWLGIGYTLLICGARGSVVG
jgi:hypothetical protein